MASLIHRFRPIAAQKLWRAPHVSAHRLYSQAAATEDPSLSDYERLLVSKLVDAFEPSSITVRDISGGCGSMFAINITSKAFKGLPMVRQHRLVNQVLADEVKKWHGLQLKTIVDNP
ncbi:altered inheritance of mitochondria protein 1 [Lipomyces japonicus]|uniref:altered inheritance of mitochondria protein 1 n=1 Tax=Lipomyces japonicus TaxID=56871 RepID=UPI0034CE5BCA